MAFISYSQATMNVWNNVWTRLSHTFCPLKGITGSSHSDKHFVSIGALVLPDTLLTSGVTRNCRHKVGCPASPAPSPSPTVVLRSLLHSARRAHIQMKPKPNSGPPIHPKDTASSMETSGSTHFGAGCRAGPGRYHPLASVAGSASMVVVVETMGRTVMLAMEVLVVVMKACTGHPRHMATVMVLVRDSQETQAPAMEESRPGLPDSVSLHVMLP